MVSVSVSVSVSVCVCVCVCVRPGQDSLVTLHWRAITGVTNSSQISLTVPKHNVGAEGAGAGGGL